MDRVSVVIPLFNHAKYIKKAIESVMSQGEVVRELIVIDDGSVDDSLEIAMSLAKSYEKLRVLHHANRGAHATINRGIEESSGELISILNSDDFYLEERLAQLVRHLDANPHVALVGSNVKFIDQDGKEQTNDWYSDGLSEYLSSSYSPAALINANIFVTTSNFLVRRSVFSEIGMFAALRYAHDLEFLMRMLARGKHIAIYEGALLAYRFHATNTIKENHGAVRAELALIAAFFLQLAARNLTSLNWKDFSLFHSTLKRHSLADAAFACLTHFSSAPADSLEDSPFETRPSFKSTVTAMV